VSDEPIVVRPGDLVMCWICGRRGVLVKANRRLEQHKPAKSKPVCKASGARWPEEPPDPPAVLEDLAAVPSPEAVESARTPSGGWTRAQLAEWHVPWPPPHGWKNRLAALHEDRRRREKA
jgi:hypothetical protein